MIVISSTELTRACSGWPKHSGGDSKTFATAEAQAVSWLHLLVDKLPHNYLVGCLILNWLYYFHHKMHQYISDTEYAVHSLIDLITVEEKQLVQYQSQHENAKEKEKHLHQQFMDSQFNDDVVAMQEQAKYIAWYGTHKELAELQRQIVSLQMSIDFKSDSIVALCGAVLQIAKQGISIVHSGLSNCPAGRSIGSEHLKNVIWHGRNQSMHYEEGKLSPAVRNCFSSLEISFGNKFSLDLNSGKNLAHDVIDILGWKDYLIYEADLKTLL